MADASAVARDQLRAFIERIERLEEEKKTIADDIKDVYGEAKGCGFDTVILRKVISIRKQDRNERAEQEAILETYLVALGMLSERAEDHEASVGSPAVLSSLTTREAEESVVPHSPETARNEPEAAAEVAGDYLREPVAAEQGQIIREGDAPRETDRLVGDASCPDTEFSQPEMAAQCAAPEKDAAEGGRDVEAFGGAALVLTHSKTPSSASHAANAGGDDVDRSGSPATHLVTGEGTANSALPAKYKLRPHCQNPGEACGGYGDKHCHNCLRAMREYEAA